MIQLTADNWYDAWYKLHECFAKNPETSIDQRFATRAVSFANKVTISTNELAGLSHTMVGYTSYKLSLFDRNYIIPGKKEEVGQLLVDRIKAGRKLTIVSYPFNIDSKAHEQGPCVINLLITLWKQRDGWHIRIEANMRVAEVTRRLLVDFLKFQSIIDYWTGILAPYNPKLDGIIFNSAAIYAEPISLTIAHYVFEDLKFDRDHWLHRATQTKIADYETKELKFKRGRRIKKHVQRLQEGK